MSNKINQNHHSDQQIKHVSICKNFLMGTCFKHPTQCNLRHEFDIDEMQKTLQFCHDHQNHGCLRENCSFLHTTKEEEKLFRTSGVIPQVLCGRYSAMAATANMSNPETVQQIAMYINESYGGQLPPLPPQGLQTMTAPPPPPPPAPLPVQLAPPPPPPPTATVPITRPNSAYPPMPAQNRISNFTTQPPAPTVLPRFDASVPPPPFYPTQVHQNKNVKRPADTIEAGPSKVRKAGGSTPEIPCSECVQKEQSIGLYKKELDRLHTEEEHLSLIYKKKMEEFEELMSVLKALVDPDMLKFWEIYVEDVPQSRTPAQDKAAQLGQIASLASGSSMSRFLTLADFLLNHRGVMDSIQPLAPAPPPSVRLNESLLQTLTTIQRRMSSTNTSTSYELRQAIDAMRHSQPDRLPSQLRASDASRQVTVATTISGSNGIRLSSIANTVEPALHAQNMYSGPSGANPRYSGNFGLVPPVPGPSGVNSRYPGTQANMYQVTGAPGPSGPRPTTATQPSYHPGIPPPISARPFYGSCYNPRAAGAPPAPRPPGPSQDTRYNQYPPYSAYNVQQYPPY